VVSGPFGSNLKVSDYKNKGVPILRLQRELLAHNKVNPLRSSAPGSSAHSSLTLETSGILGRCTHFPNQSYVMNYKMLRNIYVIA
jgi:hypothetical protein